ncbi:alpha amylase catalytic subunit [Scardovia inopinata]|uniref:Glycosyl hydrolase family 13 catalytic domain-containing protein n=1 Tax=Scardovia inopinata F0304 TaxID=641146 RepID=W5IJ62_SCAIO|nr:alpha-amylase family glycosyl hydrolase [Scardovia inopinata]EFG26903.2 hypothetical protein HMPREF9020_00532 [Scardovia inopinata F0304]BAR06508.1 putative amylase [Scardovia inopinata JCM 12537]SUV52025.1 alpha amylase catalytic subunit [Scardovia inopinata]
MTQEADLTDRRKDLTDLSNHLPADPSQIDTSSPHHPQWLDDAVFYEIYPQSFFDSNQDGIGDIPGIISKLDYIKSLGCTALWINPCFDSPFKDAGYDVRNYRQVAARYGTNEDLITLFEQAHSRGIHVLLDLVPGHTSEEHPWFISSSQDSTQTTGHNLTDYQDFSHRYIWTDSAFSDGDGMPFIGGEGQRDATYILNFFKCQPALNYGFGDPHRPWQEAAGSNHPLETEAAMVDIMRFWLSRGCDGFRVDMADSLVKRDTDRKTYTIAAWKRMLAPIHRDFPQAAFVSEWGRPDQSLEAGFDMDFYLDWRWDGKPNGYNRLLRNTDTPLSRKEDLSYFNADSPVCPLDFLSDYLPQYHQLQKAHPQGSFSFITCNHDTPRVGGRLEKEEIALAWAMILTMPGVPFIYYGDEIGMRYRSLATKEGGYRRTGSRSPMQWSSYDKDTNPACGFSTADPSELYLPIDAEGASRGITVEDQDQDPDSLLSFVRTLVSLRHSYRALGRSGTFTPLLASDKHRCLIYSRQLPELKDQLPAPEDSVKRSGTEAERLICALNPGRQAETVSFFLQDVSDEDCDNLSLSTVLRYQNGRKESAPLDFSLSRPIDLHRSTEEGNKCQRTSQAGTGPIQVTVTLPGQSFILLK